MKVKDNMGEKFHAKSQRKKYKTETSLRETKLNKITERTRVRRNKDD